MKIQIFKEDNDESVYYRLNTNTDKNVLNFENIKLLAVDILNSKKNGKTNEIEIEISDTNLELYKNTLKAILKSVEEDDELIELFEKQSIQESIEVINENEEILVVENTDLD